MSSQRRWAWLALVASVSGLVFAHTAAASATTTQSQSTALTTQIKPVIQGLLDRQQPPPKTMLSVVHAYVVRINWADIQPTQGGPIVANNAIDQAIARVNQPDFAKVGMALKLRVFAGVGAPLWAKSLGGDPIPYYGSPTDGGGSGTIGRFWTTAFGNAYNDLQRKLAAKYDSVPSIREITVSRCTTMYDEPFVRSFGDPRNVAALVAAGYTTDADKQCIVDSIAAHNVWAQTTSDVDFTPFPLIAYPNGSRDLAFTESVMATCRSLLGVRCGLQNNSISSEKLINPQYADMYAHMTALGPPLILQTARASAIGDIPTVLAGAVTIGANSIELPNGYVKWSLSMLQNTLSLLLSNPTV
jgi:hypothetical protein